MLLLLQLRDCLVLLRHADVDGNLPLHVACQNSHSAIVKALLQEDSSVIESSNKYVLRQCPTSTCYVTVQHVCATSPPNNTSCYEFVYAGIEAFSL